VTPAHDPLPDNSPSLAKRPGEADDDSAPITYWLIVPGEFSLRVRAADASRIPTGLPIAHFSEGERRPIDELQELLACTSSLAGKLLEATASNDAKQLT
jgi:hypothetical protein